jgi:hypothetical protein
MTLSIMEQSYYAECHLSLVSIVLSVANKPIMLSVIMLSVVAPFAGQHGDINFLNQPTKFPKSL